MMKYVYLTLIALTSNVFCYSQAELGSHTITLLNPRTELESKYSSEKIFQLIDATALFLDSMSMSNGFNQLAISLKHGLTNGKFQVFDSQYNILTTEQT